MIRSRVFVAVLGAFGFLTGGAYAGIIGVTGATQVVSTPADWHPGVYESSQWVRVFCFECPGTLTGPSTGGEVVPGTYLGLGGSTFASLAPVVYPAGTAYNAYIIHLDPVGTGSSVSLQGSITFDAPIIYITDSIVDSPIHQWLEGGDVVTLSADLRTLSYRFSAGAGVDEVFLATSVPEPGTLLLIVPVALLWWCGRRRRN